MTQFTMFGVEFADPTIPWPERGSGGRELTARAGWERQTISTMIRGEPAQIEAMCREPLAVNVMVEGEGFAICLAASGWRISFGGRVFARCDDAMRAAEALMVADQAWSAVPRSDFSQHQIATLKAIVEAAERRGEILLDRVFPT